jgi:hypothetical protein
MQAFKTAGSLSIAQTLARSAGSVVSPVMVIAICTLLVRRGGVSCRMGRSAYDNGSRDVASLRIGRGAFALPRAMKTAGSNLSKK